MTTGARIISLVVIAAHVLAAAVPCPSPSSGAVSDRVTMTVEDARSLLELSRTQESAGRTGLHPGGAAAIEAGAQTAHRMHTVGDTQAAHSAQSMSSTDAPPPCHDDNGETGVEARTIAGPLLFLLPGCPCGCDQRAPVAGASTARVGAGVPPSTLLSDAAPPGLAEATWRLTPAPDVVPALPEPVPRLSTLV